MSARRITWTASAAQVRTLERIANALNGIRWCCHDNTAQSVFNGFFKSLLDDVFDDTEMMIENIYNGIDTGAKETSAKHRHRAQEAENALRREFQYHSISKGD